MDDEDVGVVVGIGVVGAVRDEGDPLTVGRPARTRVVIGAVRERQRVSVTVGPDDAEVVVLVGEEALPVSPDQGAGDHPGVSGGLRSRGRLRADHDERPAVGRPVELADAAGNAGHHLPMLSVRAGDDHLGAVGAVGEKGQALAVGGEARLRRALAALDHRPWRAARGGHQVEVLAKLVAVLHVCLGDVGEGAPVWGDLKGVHDPKGVGVFRRHGPPDRRVGPGAGRRRHEDREERRTSSLHGNQILRVRILYPSSAGGEAPVQRWITRTLRDD